MTQLNSLETSKLFGAKIGAMVQNEESRTVLAETLTSEAQVRVLADTADHVHLLIPADVDHAKVAADDEAYFEELGRLALGACLFDVLPE